LFLKLPEYLCFQETKRSFQFSGGGGGTGEGREGSIFEKRMGTPGRGEEWIQRLKDRGGIGRDPKFPIFASFLLLVFCHGPLANIRYLL
jgi:hypothetical protein